MLSKIIKALMIVMLLIIIHQIYIDFKKNHSEKQMLTSNLNDLDDYLQKKDNHVKGFLKIEDISLQAPIYKFDYYKNNVDYGLEIIKKEQPIIIASHSGNSKIALFNSLIKLKENSNSIIEINRITSSYILKTKNIINKEEQVEFNSNCNLYLVTCYKQNQRLVLCYLAK